jgi:putative SOS response-associated peptidase YedK
MCGRFVITSPPAALRQIFGYLDQPNFPPRHNIAPTQPIPVVIVENGIRHFRLMRWGLLPAWVKDPREFTLLINARGDLAGKTGLQERDQTPPLPDPSGRLL